MNVQKIIDTHNYLEIAEAAGISRPSLKSGKPGKKDWRGSAFAKVDALRKLDTDNEEVNKMITANYLDRYNGSATIAKILEDDETQRDIVKAVRIAEANVAEIIDEQVEDLLPEMFIDGLTKFGKDYQFWFDNRNKWFDAPIDYLVQVLDSGDYAGFLAKYFPDWEVA